MRTTLIFITMLSVLLLGCENDDTLDRPMNTLEADAGSLGSGPLFTGQPITLNGSKSKDKAGKPFQYLWHLSGKTPVPGIDKITSIGLDGAFFAKLSITNSKIVHGHGYGIALEDDRTTINDNVETINRFEDLSLGSVFK